MVTIEIEYAGTPGTERVKATWYYVRDMCLTYRPDGEPDGTEVHIPIVQIARFKTVEAPQGRAPIRGSGATAVYGR